MTNNIDNVQGRVPVAPKLETLPHDNLVAHDLADIFPPMEDDQFDALVADILRRGLLNPITLYHGKILDGRNRYRAAKEAGYELMRRDFRDLPPGEDAKAFVISTNAIG